MATSCELAEKEPLHLHGTAQGSVSPMGPAPGLPFP